MHTKISRFAAIALLGAAFTFGVTAQDKSTAPKAGRYELRTPTRDGIGKFYHGREIAHVMGHQAADWLERPNREEEENPSKAIEALKLKPGEVVADIGAGTGYYSWRMAQKVGATGTVYGVEIQQEMIDLIHKNMAKRNVQNVKTILGTTTDPKLPAASIDTVLMVDVYHEFDFPYEMMENICKGLKVGGRVVFIEFRGEDTKVPIKLLHKMTEAQVKNEMADLPLEFVENIPGLPWQHMLVFRKKG